MAAKPGYPLAGLEIVAYADPPPAYLLPSIVAPIFRQRQAPHDLILPPYELSGDELVGGALDGKGALKKMVWLKAAVSLCQPITPRPEHVLWLDRNYAWAYGPRSEVLDRLRQHAAVSLERAVDALRERRFKEALECAQTALAADEDCYDAVIVKAVVYTVQQNPTFVNELRHLAHAVDLKQDFDGEVNKLRRVVPRSSTSPCTSIAAPWVRNQERIEQVLAQNGYETVAAFAHV